MQIVLVYVLVLTIRAIDLVWAKCVQLKYKVATKTNQDRPPGLLGRAVWLTIKTTPI